MSKRPASPSKEQRPSPSGPKKLKASDNDSANIKVSVRVRPFTAKERSSKQPNLVSMDPERQITQLDAPPNQDILTDEQSYRRSTTFSRRSMSNQPKVFKFDHSLSSFDPNDKSFVDQKETYETVGREYLYHTLDGYNTCVFAYGQTGSGKSYTMMGSNDNPGLIPRICKELFQRSEKLLNEKQITVTVKISYFEIYNEYVYDLLNIPELQSEKQQSKSLQSRRSTISTGTVKESLQKLKVRESPEYGPYVENLVEFPVKDYDEVAKYFEIGNSNRKTAATKMNLSSSRSHAIFTISVKQIEYSDILTGKVLNVKKSTLRLIDLAGSERQSTTGAVGQRLKEGSTINKSLTCLGRVINALAKANTSQVSEKPEKSLIPYRDSTLTWILKESLGGNSKTAMIACISPCDYEETLSTLWYASNAKKIKTDAKINKDEASKLNDELSNKLHSMQNKIKQLEAELSKKSVSQKAEKEKEIIQATQHKISNNYKKYLEYYDEKLIEEESKNKILINEINRLRAENMELNNSLNSIIGPIFNDSYLQDDNDADEDVRKVLQIKNKKLEMNLKRSKTVNFTTLAPIKSPRKNSTVDPTSPYKASHMGLKDLAEQGKENSLTLSTKSGDSQPSPSRSPLSKKANVDSTKMKKFDELFRAFDDLKNTCQQTQTSMQNDLQRFNPERFQNDFTTKD